MHENMRPSSPFAPDEPNINYTLSIAAVKSGYFETAMTNPILSEEETEEGYEIESRQEFESLRTTNDADTEKELQEEETTREEWDLNKKTSETTGDVTAEDAYEVNEEGTVQSSFYGTISLNAAKSGWENMKVKKKLKSAKKKIGRFVKSASRSRLHGLDEESSRAVSSRTSSSIGPTSSGAADAREPPSRDQDTVQEKPVASTKAVVANEVAKRELPPLAPPSQPPLSQPPPPSPPPPPSISPKSSPKHKPDEAVEEPIENVATIPDTTKDTTQDQQRSVRSPRQEEAKAKSEAKIKSPKKRVLPVLDIASYSDERDSFDESTRRDLDSFASHQITPRTYVIDDDSASQIDDDSWSRDEKATSSLGCFACGAFSPKEDWDEEDEPDDETVESDSEEGRVADAVITIQEHALRLGLTEYELLEMIKDE